MEMDSALSISKLLGSEWLPAGYGSVVLLLFCLPGREHGQNEKSFQTRMERIIIVRNVY